MTEELKELAGKSSIPFRNLKWRHLIEFAQRYGVGVEEVEQLPADKRAEAIAWLFWRISGSNEPFEEFLDKEIPVDLFQSIA